MAALTDQLHDEVDAREEVRNAMAEEVKAVVMAGLKAALEMGDMRAALRFLAEKVEDEVVTDATTAEFQRAAKAAAKRVGGR
jgi:hypothetical protein